MALMMNRGWRMGLLSKFKEKIHSFNEAYFNDFFENTTTFSNEEEQLLVEKYANELEKVESKFYEYKDHAENIIKEVSKTINRTVVTKGAIVNFTPFYSERLGSKLNGKIIAEPIDSNYCMKYHYDKNDRVVMVEEYSMFLKRFMMTEIYLYENHYAQRLIFSSGVLSRMMIFDNPFANTNLCFSFSSHPQGGKMMEQFVYEDNRLKTINFGRSEGNYQETFIYEKDKLIMIEQTNPHAKKRLLYTTKKPNFKKIQVAVAARLKHMIANQDNDFNALGIEGFLDQQPPMICVCFTKEEKPDDLIADWHVVMNDIVVYDWQFNEEQERKCIKMIAEIIVSLVDDGTLAGKLVYFHQNQVSVSRLYSGAKNIFKKANLNIQ